MNTTRAIHLISIPSNPQSDVLKKRKLLKGFCLQCICFYFLLFSCQAQITQVCDLKFGNDLSDLNFTDSRNNGVLMMIPKPFDTTRCRNQLAMASYEHRVVAYEKALRSITSQPDKQSAIVYARAMEICERIGLNSDVTSKLAEGVNAFAYGGQAIQQAIPSLPQVISSLADAKGFGLKMEKFSDALKVMDWSFFGAEVVLQAMMYEAISTQNIQDRLDLLWENRAIFSDPAIHEALANVREQFDEIGVSFFRGLGLSVRDHMEELFVRSMSLSSEVFVQSVIQQAGLGAGGAAWCAALPAALLMGVLWDFYEQGDALEQASLNATLYWSISVGLKDIRPSSALTIELLEASQLNFATECRRIFSVWTSEIIDFFVPWRSYSELKSYYEQQKADFETRISQHSYPSVEVESVLSLPSHEIGVKFSASEELDGIVTATLIKGAQVLARLDVAPGVVSNTYTLTFPAQELSTGTDPLHLVVVSRAGYETKEKIDINTSAGLTQGTVSPVSGSSEDIFEFRVIFQSNINNPPGAGGVKVNIDNMEYTMDPDGESWSSGVAFKLNRMLAPGNHVYYFTADLGGGQTARLPASGSWSLPVALSVAGWDAEATSLNLSASRLKPGQTVTVNGSVYNNSTSGNTYVNLPWRLQLIDPSGTVADTRTGVLGSLSAPNGANIPTQSFTLSSEGNYQVVLSVLPDRDSNAGNDSRSSVILVSNQESTKQYYFTEAGSFINFFNVGETYPNSGVSYEFRGMTSSRVTFSINGTLRNVNAQSYRVDGGSIMFVEWISNIGTPYATVSFGTERPNYLVYDQNDLSCYSGERVVFLAHCAGESAGNSFEATTPDFYGSSGSQVESWESGFTRSNANKSCYFKFDVSSSAAAGDYTFLMKARLASGQYMRELRIRVKDRPPTITGLSTNLFMPGQAISIAGQNLGSSGTLYLADQVVPTTSWSASQVQFIVPQNASAGLLRVVNSAGSSGGWSYMVQSSPKLVLYPGFPNIAFGNVQVGTASAWNSVTLSNVGSSALLVNLVGWLTPSASFNAEFNDSLGNVITNAAFQIAPTGRITARFQLHPTSLGGYTNAYILSHNDSASGSAAILNLAGTAVDTNQPAISLAVPTSSGVYTSSSPSITIAGTASDDYQLASVWYISSAGSAATNNQPSGVWSFPSIPLIEGSNITITASARDSSGNTSSASLVIRHENPTLTITSGSQLPLGTVNIGYTQTLAAAGGVLPYAWAFASAAPDWLSLTPVGVLSGMPTNTSTNTFSIKVTGANGASATNSFTLAVLNQSTRTLALGGDLNYGSVAVGQSAIRTLYITNLGNATLTIANLVFSTNVFSGTFQGAIQSGGYVGVLITFSPPSSQSYSGTIAVTSDAMGTNGPGYVVLTGSGTNAQPDSLTQGLVAHLPLNGNSQDASGRTHHGQDSQVTYVTDRTGAPNGAALFNGSTSKITIPHSSDFNFGTGSFSLACWVRADGLTQPSGGTLVSKFYETPVWDQRWRLDCNASGQAQMHWSNGSVNDHEAYSVDTMELGAWHHVAVIMRRDGTNDCEIYLDGIRKTVGGRTSPMAGSFDNAMPIQLGQDTVYNMPFKGCMDDVRIYNRALKPEEVSMLAEVSGIPFINTTTLPSGFVNVSYAQTLMASGGLAPYTWALASGVLPPGLILSPSGVMSGVPTTPATNFFAIKVTGGNGLSSTNPFTMVVLSNDTNPLFAFDTATWEGIRYAYNNYQGTWFPAVTDGVASLMYNDYSWAMLRTKTNLSRGTYVSCEALPYLASGGVNGDGARIGFGDQWPNYQGRFVGLELQGGQIHIYDSAQGGRVRLIGGYTSGSWTAWTLGINNSGSLIVSRSGYSDEVFTPTNSFFTSFRFLLNANDTTDGMLVRNVQKVNPGQAIRIQAHKLPGGKVVFSWPAQAGRSYQLHYRTNLVQGSWLPLGSPIPVSSSSGSFTNPASADKQQFYRLEALQ